MTKMNHIANSYYYYYYYFTIDFSKVDLQCTDL